MRPFFVRAAALAALALMPGIPFSLGSTQDPDLDAAPVLRLVEELRIGSASDPNIGFSAIGQVDLDRDGQVYVFDTQDRQIRVYSASGRLVRTIGRRGSGPGEFETSVAFGVKGDTVWAIEYPGVDSEITLFDRNGTLLSTATSAGVEAPARGSTTYLLRPALMRPDGNFISQGFIFRTVRGRAATGAGPADTVRVPRVLFDTRGAPVDTVMWELDPPPPPGPPPQVVTTAGGNRRTVPRPYGDGDMVLKFEDGRIVIQRPTPQNAAQSVLRVTREGVRGDNIYSRSYSYRAVGYPPALLDSIAARSLRSTGFAVVGGTVVQNVPDSSAQTRAAVRQAMSFPRYQPPVQSAFVGADASVWLRREDNVGPTSRWVLLDPQGNPRGRTELPQRLRLVWSSGDVVWGALPDEDDVPWLLRFRISRQ
jgi:hypothetical protein